MSGDRLSMPHLSCPCGEHFGPGWSERTLPSSSLLVDFLNNLICDPSEHASPVVSLWVTFWNWMIWAQLTCRRPCWWIFEWFDLWPFWARLTCRFLVGNLLPGCSERSSPVVVLAGSLFEVVDLVGFFEHVSLHDAKDLVVQRSSACCKNTQATCATWWTWSMWNETCGVRLLLIML